MRLRRILPAFLLIFLCPAVGLFCLQFTKNMSWNETVRRDAGSRGGNSRQGAILTSAQLGDLGQIEATGHGPAAQDAGRQFFRETAGRARQPQAADDPFLRMLSEGRAEGALAIQSYAQGVPVLGPAAWQARAGRMSDVEILRALRAQAGGSFGSFFSRMFGDASDSSLIAEAADTAEQNPFSRVRESLGEKAAEEAEETAADTSAREKSPPEGETPPETKPADSTQATPPQVTPVSAPKPYLMLRMGDDGALQALEANQTGTGGFEAPELGIADFNLMTFTDAPEFPTALAVADYNGDGMPDIALHQGPWGQLRFFLGREDGSYEEAFRVQVGSGPRSLAVGDFNRDGLMDIAISPIGSGILTCLFGDAGCVYRFKSYWLDVYRDYLIAADTTGTGALDLVGMSFANRASVLVDFSQPEGSPGRSFDFAPSLAREFTTSLGWQSRLNAVALSSNLALNMENRMRQLINVLNVAAGSRIWVIAGDLDNSGRLSVSIATPRRKP